MVSAAGVRYQCYLLLLPTPDIHALLKWFSSDTSPDYEKVMKQAFSSQPGDLV